RFPSNTELRFMAYQAIVNGARGLSFFGGHLTQVVSPADARAGWNWTFWRESLQPLVQQLASTALAPALVAPAARLTVRASTTDVELGCARPRHSPTCSRCAAAARPRGSSSRGYRRR